LQDVQQTEQLVLRALVVGGAIAVLLAIGGAILFRQQLERRVAAVRRTALEIGAGDLQIAEAESGTRRQLFQPIRLKEIVTDVVELYDAAAEEKGIALVIDNHDGEPTTLGDKDLLASAAANLIDNALKYAGTTVTVRVRATEERNTVSLIVQDDGPGIPAEERAKVATRFYRLDRSRSLPGNGLGLPIVAAISHLHGGTLSLEGAGPGLIARIVLPSVHATGALAHQKPREERSGTLGLDGIRRPALTG
jgi:signal transduction histidine kinase